MDLLSVHDIPEPTVVPATPTGEEGTDAPLAASELATPTLDQELADLKKTLGGVGASLGGWWGRVQKQSASALNASGISAQLDTARKDLASLNLLEKARKEAAWLGEQAREGYASVKEELEKGPDAQPGEGAKGGAIIGVDGSVIPALAEDKGKGKAVDSPPSETSASPEISQTNPEDPATSAPLTGFLTRLARENPKLSSQFTTFQTRLASLPHNVQTSVQSTLSSQNLSDVQKLAEGYLAKSEGYLQGVGKELRELVNDAVKVVPPPDAPATAANAARREERRRKAQEALAASGGRRELLVGKLRREPGVMLVDPSADAAFGAFEKQVAESGGINGEAWVKRRKEELEGHEGDDEGEAAALKESFESIVPSKLSEDVFWTRFFYRMHQVDEEEARRRVVLGAAQQADEDFSWDLEDESTTSEAGEAGQTPLGGSADARPAHKTSAATLKPARPARETGLNPAEPAAEDDWGIDDASIPTSPVASTTPAPPAPPLRQQPPAGVAVAGSGRNSSEDGSGMGTSVAGTTSSFDVVSAQPSGDEAARLGVGAKHEDDEDSDWE